MANQQRRLRRLILTEEAEAALTRTLPPPWPLPPERTDRARIDQLLGRDIAHQGAALLADPLAQPGLAAVLERSGPIVVLDQVTDPRNIGAIMRSAAAFGAAAVITQDRNAPEETGSLAKAASGALETMPLLRAVNIARTLIALKAANVWCVGLDAAGKPLSGSFFAGRRVALVLGAEGEGLRRLTRETCDEIAGLSIKGVVESLNVSAAAAVAQLHELDAGGMSYDPEPAAAALHRMRLERRLVLPLPAEIVPPTEVEGATAQLALARLVGAVPCAGFKIGATGKRMQEYLGLTGPAAGFMQAATVIRDHGAVRFADCIKPGVECEVAVRLAHDLPPGAYTSETVAAAVGGVRCGYRNRREPLRRPEDTWHADADCRSGLLRRCRSLPVSQAVPTGTHWKLERCAAAS